MHKRHKSVIKVAPNQYCLNSGTPKVISNGCYDCNMEEENDMARLAPTDEQLRNKNIHPIKNHSPKY